LDASLGTAMWMVLVPTPRTEDTPPAPDSQILPTPGHWPFVAGDELARVRVGDTEAPACETAVRAAGPATNDVTVTNATVLLRMPPVAFCDIIDPPRFVRASI
jgi:hypothetical protein